MMQLAHLSPNRKILVSGLLVLTIAACGSNGALRGINTLGQAFVNAFNQGPNTQPVDPDNVTLTQTPGVEPFNP